MAIEAGKLKRTPPTSVLADVLRGIQVMLQPVAANKGSGSSSSSATTSWRW